MPVEVVGIASSNPTDPLAPISYQLRDLLDDDVLMDVQYCGVCHSDIHMNRNEWKSAQYPVVTGHEVAGIVNAVGSKVTKYKPGDRVGVGCLVDSCRNCQYCKDELEQYCASHTQTYNSVGRDGKMTKGGYGKKLVASERFVFKVPDNVPLEKAAPLLCAGITTYSPMKHLKMDRPGLTIGVIGLGGLGHMAVKFGVAFGNKVVVISRTPSKEAIAKELGATGFVISTDAEQVKGAKESMDYIVDTVSGKKDMSLYFTMLKVDGTLVTVGAPPVGEMLNVAPFDLIMRRKTLLGSTIGGTKETQEMLDYCAQHNITPEIEMISAEKINEAYERILKSDVKFRFVIDVKNSLPDTL